MTAVYEVVFPIHDARQPYADMLGTATAEWARGASALGRRPAGPPELRFAWRRGRRVLIATGPVEDAR